MSFGKYAFLRKHVAGYNKYLRWLFVHPPRLQHVHDNIAACSLGWSKNNVFETIFFYFALGFVGVGSVEETYLSRTIASLFFSSAYSSGSKDPSRKPFNSGLRSAKPPTASHGTKSGWLRVIFAICTAFAFSFSPGSCCSVIFLAAS